MYVKTTLFAAASLLVVANATANFDLAPPHATDIVARSSSTANELGEIINLKVKCDDICHKPWVACVNECGGGSWCEYKCNCDLFNNRDDICRTCGCVGNIDNCPAKLDTRSDIQDDVAADQSFVPELCVNCGKGINRCKKECAVPGPACDNSCSCHWKRTSQHCKERDVRCVTGRAGRNLDAVPIEMLDDPAVKVLPESSKRAVPIEFLDDPAVKKLPNARAVPIESFDDPPVQHLHAPDAEGA